MHWCEPILRGSDDVKAGVGVDGDEFVNPAPVSGSEIDDGDVAGQDRSDGVLLRVGSVAVQQQPAGFGDHRCGRGQAAAMSIEQRQACVVASCPPVRRGEPDVGVNQQHERSGAALGVWGSAQHRGVGRSPIRVTRVDATQEPLKTGWFGPVSDKISDELGRGHVTLSRRSRKSGSDVVGEFDRGHRFQ